MDRSHGVTLASARACALMAALALGACGIDLKPVACLSSQDCAGFGPCIAGVCQASTDPAIRVVSPPGGLLNSNSAVIQVDIQNFILDPNAVGGAPEAGHGHWHLYLNDEYKGISATHEFALTRLPMGVNQIRVQLAQNNHQELDAPPGTVSLEVTTESRALLITSPDVASGQTFEVAQGDGIPISVSLSNFDLDPDSVGGDPDPCLCRGHLHVYVDDVLQVMVAEPTFTVDTADMHLDQDVPLEPGPHVLEIRLAQNNHVEIDPPVFDRLSFDLVAPEDGTGDGTGTTP